MADIRDDVDVETLVQIGGEPSGEYLDYETTLANYPDEDPEYYVLPDNVTNIDHQRDDGTAQGRPDQPAGHRLPGAPARPASRTG